MRKSLFIFTAAVVLFAASCTKDDTLLYNECCMGIMENGTFRTDEGNLYQIKEQTCEGRLDTMGRAIILCDILSRVQDNIYNVRLRSMGKVLTKTALKSGSTDDATVGTDAINLYRCWNSGGYFNMYYGITRLKSSTTKHLINLVMDEAASNSDTLYFSLRHNAYGESFDNLKLTDTQKADLALGSGYVSFDVESVIPADINEAVLKISWDWHKTDGTYLIEEKKNYSISGEWQRTTQK